MAEPGANEAGQDRKLVLVGLGASAGGLAALRQVFASTPIDGNIAYVVVVHLSPDHESFLADLLQSHSDLPVTQVTEDTHIEPNHVYVIPPGRNLSTIDSSLRLSPLEEKRRERAPIDHFFRTLAEQHRERAIAVVLSGTGSDGVVGLSRVKEYGGLAVAQDPAEAEYAGMPQSAVATGLVDLVLPLKQIPGEVLRYASSEPRVRVPADGAAVERREREVMRKVFAQLRAHTGHDFSGYKPSTVMRRVRRRMQLSGADELEAYLEFLRRDPGEVEALFGDLLINVTNFFRDPEAFGVLEREVVPKLFEGKGPDDQVRVWAAGCATGEEAYSLGMVLLEHAAGLEHPPEVQVFATDVYPGALARAREGLYPGTVAADIAEARVRHFFVAEGDAYRVRKELRERVLFAPHNLLGDPPFSKLDLIACRNVLIYLKREVQRDVIRLFHYALREGGYLFLGSSESLDEPELFPELNKAAHLYRRGRAAGAELRLPDLPFARSTFPAPSPLPAAHGEARDGYGALHARLAARYAPPSVLVDRAQALVHVSETAGRFLRTPGGELTDDLLRRVLEPLRAELRAVLYEALEHRRPAASRPVPLAVEGRPREVTLQVRPVSEEGLEGYVLVVFDEREPQIETADALVEDDGAVRRLEERLAASKRQLQTVVEEYETSREEMRASNEELQSINEELRSTAEELETSKEELQSINEELVTVNQENRHKVEELSQLTGDLQNLFAATNVATVFLDRELRIKRFTPALSELFNVIPADRGRPLAHLTHRLSDARLIEDAQAVLRTLQPVERELRSEAGRWYLLRLSPYRTTDDRIDGTVLTFVDITRIKRSEEDRRRSEARLRLVVENAPGYAIFTVDPTGRVDSWNRGAERVFGYTEAEIVGQPASVVFTPEDREAGVPARELEAAARNGSAPDRRWHLRKNGERFWVDGVTTALHDAEGRLYGFAKIGRDDTERRGAEEERERLLDELRLLNETLEQRVAERTEALQLSERRFSQAFHAGPVAACITTLGDETFLEVNEAFTKLTGYGREAALGRTARELGVWSSWEDLGAIERSGHGNGSFHNLELRLRTREGSIIDILLSGEVIELDGEKAFLKLFYDITERRRSEAQLMQAIQSVMGDTTWFSQSVMERLARLRSGNTDPGEKVELTQREKQILGRIAQGKSNTAISEELGIKPQTVRNYVAAVYDKLGVRSRAEAVVWARERGLAGF